MKNSSRKTLSLWVGGSAGDGIASVGESFAKIASRNGLHVYSYNSYQSVIRGGHVWFQLRCGSEKVYTNQPESCHLLIALNQDTIDRHVDGIAEGGGILYNNERLQVKKEQLKAGTHDFGLPISKLTKSAIMQNTVAMGALMFLSDLPLSTLEEALRERFGKKSQEIIDANVGAAQAGYSYAKENWKSLGIGLTLSKKHRLVMIGNQAIGLGAMVAGCRFYSAYPMTPASSIMHYITPRAKKYGVVFKQCEDEIASMAMAVGAGHAGARSMTGTSGGGFALMTEAIGLAGMIEAPVVICNVMRGGPSTGLPTKTEQGDLFQIVGAGQGEYPRVIFALSTIEDAFYTTQHAFNFADKYQCPVILLSDLLLSEHTETVEDLDLKTVKIDRGETLTEWNSSEPYLRYKNTPSGVSPRVLPGAKNALYVAASDEHDEKGIVISDVFTNPVIRKMMVEKRMRKMVNAKKELEKLFPVKLEGPADADVTLITWGSTYSYVQAMARRLNDEGTKTNILLIRVVAPFLTEQTTAALKKVKRGIIIEMNYTGQMQRLLRMETGISISDRINKYDGEPFEPNQLYQDIKKILSSKQSGVRTAEAVASR